jgi:hypothetical protein
MDFETASELLSDECRRAVVEILRDDSPISRRRLTDRLATRSIGADENAETGHPDPATRYRMHVAFHHDHLPRLADAGLIDYDDETVAATPELEAFLAWFRPFDRDRETPGDSEETEDELRNRLMAFYA